MFSDAFEDPLDISRFPNSVEFGEDCFFELFRSDPRLHFYFFTIEFEVGDEANSKGKLNEALRVFRSLYHFQKSFLGRRLADEFFVRSFLFAMEVEKEQKESKNGAQEFHMKLV